MDSKATLEVLNGDIDVDNHEWVTITKCSEDNDDEGYKGIVYLNDDQTFQRMMGGGEPNSTWPYRSFETVFDQFRLNWNMDVKMEQAEKEEQKQTIGEGVMSFFNKISTSSEQTKAVEEKPTMEEKPQEDEKPQEEEKPQEDEKPQEEEKPTMEEKPQEEEKPTMEETTKSNSFIDWLTGKDTEKSSSGLNNCKKVKVMKEEQGRHRVIMIQKKEDERKSK